ncbi:hypothetical protein TU94_17060 [Streptomyces cyaneogriseus subsp. noncyanogenus]|uniref:Uncharacterized protein n=1 Tax=Streptomyces cyaneogriseus subsp. noncyanogenus TaxID=477245 RepID=A0A0C5GEZ5_9ACTN|nr:hypothetical protein [Streptomyces cyaneogriseus]AJP02931.1 hypothetical protein TU94_17060 [Streptomyces cyaneogriseus subsp. noncyanogenus]
MGPDTVIAGAATVIALGSLWVSYTQTRDSRRHSRQSVRPALQMRRVKHYKGTEAGLSIVNAGLGPAVVTRSVVRLDGEVLGEWNYHTQQLLLSSLPARPKAHSMRSGSFMLPGRSTWLLSLDEYSEDEHDWFWDLITRRLVIEIFYESLYGGENFSVTPPEF